MMFMGQYNHTIDPKGRLIIPSKFRDLLGDEFIVTKGLDGCLFVFPKNEWQIIEEKLRTLPLNNKSARKFIRFLVAGATTCELDKQGRILLPQVLRDFAQLEKDVVLAGNLNRVEIWDAANWTENNAYDDMDDIADSIRPDGVYVDGTLGGGGHAWEICSRLSEKGRLIGIDQDAAAIEAAAKRLEEFKDRVTIVRGNYCDMRKILGEQSITSVDGVILDLGVSSYQLDEASRGFTYREDAPLDMRMDQRQTLTARDIVNGYSEPELYRIIRDYGEERFAKNIARHIVNARNQKTLETTGELIHVIKAAIPMKMRATGGHPAKRTFQAIRIELNRELEVLENSLDDMIDLLNDHGRICVITFHSLEDRIVKDKFRYNENPCTCPKDFPVCVCGKRPKGRVVTRKPIVPTARELEENKRAKSSKLRVFEKEIH